MWKSVHAALDFSLIVSANNSLNSSNESSKEASRRNSLERNLVKGPPMELAATDQLDKKTPEIIITNAAPEKKSSLKKKVNKNEDAPLMSNEHNQGDSTPAKSPTVEDFDKIKDAGIMTD